MSKPLAKSLHTVSVLVSVSLHVLQSDMDVHTNAQAVAKALAILGLSDAPDIYDLTGAALKKLSKI